MSALGQKQTSAVQEGMSALPPKADIVRRPNNLITRRSFPTARCAWSRATLKRQSALHCATCGRGRCNGHGRPRFIALARQTLVHAMKSFFDSFNQTICVFPFFLLIRFLFHLLTPHLISPGIRRFGIDQSLIE